MQTESMKKVRGKKFTILSSEWCEYYRDSTFQYGVSPCYRPLCCQNVTLTYIKLIIQCNFPFLFYRMAFFFLASHFVFGVKVLKTQALFIFKKGLSRTLIVSKYQHSFCKVIKKNLLFPFMTEQEILS